MGSCVARQPIFNKNLKIYGYELLYRFNNDCISFHGEVSPDTATSETIFNSFHDMGIERITNGKYAFINFTERLLLDKVATLLPSKLLVIEILENIEPTDEVLESCKTHRELGYTLALDDFVLKPLYERLLPVANIVKVDFLNTPIEDIKHYMTQMSKHQVIFLAEKLETHDDFELAKSMGFSLFQGYFFSRPALVKTDMRLSPLYMNRMRLINLAFNPNANYTQIANVIKQDIALTYQLFRVVNSAYFGLDYTVRNIRQALAILGMDEIKKWVTLISMSQTNNNKPGELITMSLIRARFMELLAPYAGLSKISEDMFIIGLMSLMDAIMDIPMEEIIARTHVSSAIAEPLLHKSGNAGDILTLIELYENSQWTEVQNIAARYNISLNRVSQAYLQSLEWSDKF